MATDRKQQIDTTGRQMRCRRDMKRHDPAANGLLTAFVFSASLVASAYARPSLAEVDIHIGISVPPPPAVVFSGPPEVVVVPRTQVYYVPAAADYDMYRYRTYWYINRDGYWYRSHRYGGPFKSVESRYVPRPIVVVPATYRHHPIHPHGGPPGHLKHFQHGRGHGDGHGKHGD